MNEEQDSQDSPEELQLYPVWKQAAKLAIEAFEYGDVIPLEWLREHLEVEEPEGLMTSEQHRRLAFDLLQKVDGFRSTMLEQHKRLTVNVRGVGYKIIQPPHQTDAAMKRFQREFHKSWNQAMTGLVHINESLLTLEDSRENAEAKAKLAWFKSFGAKRLSGSDNSERDE